MTSHTPRTLVQNRRTEALASAVQCAGDPSVDLKTLEESFKRVEVLEKIGKAIDKDARRELKDGMFVVSGAVLAITLLLLWRPSASGFLRADTYQVSMASTRIDFAAQATWKNAYARSSGSVFSEMKPESYTMQEMRLSDLQQESQVLRFEVGRLGNCDYFKAIEGSISGVLWDLSGSKEIAYPWRLTAEGRTSPTLSICGVRHDTLTFRSQVTSLALAREVNYGNLQRGVEPVVKDGTVNLAQEKITLSDSDIVFLEGKDGRLELAALDNAFRVRYNGDVISFRAGSPGVVAEQLPNALQRVLKGSPLATLYSALAGLVALIWGLRKIAKGS